MGSPALLDPLKAVCFEIEAQHEAAGWHDGHGPPPSVYWVYGPRGEPYRAHEMPIPHFVWAQSPWPADAVNFVADYLDMGLTSLQIAMPFALTEPIVGVIFIYEFWLVFASDDEVEEVRDMAHQRRLNTHPNRVSTRLLLCSRTDGTDLYVARRMGEGQAQVLEGFESQALGDLPAAMRNLAQVMKKRTRS